MADWPDEMPLRDRMWVRWQALKWRWKHWRERCEEPSDG